MPMAQKLDILIRLLTSAQAAEMLGIDPFTLARWRAEGRSPEYIRLSNSPKGRVMYKKEALAGTRCASLTNWSGDTSNINQTGRPCNPPEVRQ